MTSTSQVPNNDMETETTEIERSDVAADGDLIITVGEKLELHVHSLLLKMNSPVFRTMLGPDWLEGQQLANISELAPGRLSLPDDDAGGAKYLCFILHNRHDQLAASPSDLLMLSIAKIADKYNCVRSTELVFEAWFSRVREVHYGHVATAYVLNHAYRFADLSQIFMLESRRKDLKAVFLRKQSEDDFGVIVALERRYKLLYKTIVKGIALVIDQMSKLICPEDQHYINNDVGVTPEDEEDFNTDGNEPPKHCTYHERMMGIYLPHLVKSKAWPYNEEYNTLSNVLEALNVFKPIKFDWNLVDCEAERDSNWFRDEYPSMMAALINLSKSYLEDCSLCLDCIKVYPSTTAGVCRTRHPRQIAALSDSGYNPIVQHIKRVKRKLGPNHRTAGRLQ